MKKILIIDDSEAIAGMLQRQFREANYKVACAFDGQQGLEMVQSFDPDVILLDLNMPKLKGVGVFGALRASDGKLKVPVIVISGAGDEVNLFESFGAFFFKKPLDFMALLSKVEEITAGKKPIESVWPAVRARVEDAAEAAQAAKRDLSKPELDPGSTAHRDKGGTLPCKKILIAENVHSFYCALAVLLVNEGYVVDIVEKGGEELFEKIDSYQPDVMVIKFELPDQRGDEIVLKLRAHAHPPHMILYTSPENTKSQKMILNSLKDNTYHKRGLALIVETDDPGVLLKKVNALFHAV